MSILSRRGQAHVALWMVAVALSLGPLRLMEVCVATDGHLTLEGSHAGQTCESHLLRHAPWATVSTNESGTPPCIDIAAIPVVDRGGDRRVIPGLAAVSNVAKITLPAVRPGRVRAAPEALLGASQPTSLLRSVVIIA